MPRTTAIYTRVYPPDVARALAEEFGRAAWLNVNLVVMESATERRIAGLGTGASHARECAAVDLAVRAAHFALMAQEQTQ